MKYKCIVGIIFLLLAISSVAESIKGDANGDGRVSVADIAIIASHIMGDNPTDFNEKQADVNGDGRVSVADISALATLIMGGDIVNSEEETKKDTIYIKYSGSNVSFIGNELKDVKISHDQADVQVTIGENPNVVLNLSGKSDDGRISIKADTLVTLQLADIDLTSSHAPAVNSYGKQKLNVELVDGTKNQLRDSKTYTFTDAEEIANGCFSVQGALSFTGKGELTLRGKSKHAIYAKKSITFKGGTYNVLEAASDAIHSGKSVTIEGGDFKLNGMKSEAIELDNDFTMEGGTIEMAVTGAGAKGIQCGGDLNISGGTIRATASGALKNKDGDLSYCSIIKCDGNATITNGEFHLTNNSPGGKCVSVGKSLVIDDGAFDLETNGDGAEYTNVNGETDYYTSKCIAVDDSLFIHHGVIDCLSTGVGGKGIVADEYLEIGSPLDMSYMHGPTINIQTTNSSIVNDVEEDLRYGCPKAIKANNVLCIYSGDIHCTTAGMGGEGIECNKEMFVYGGNIECVCHDDGINVGEKLEVQGGQIYCNSEDNDGIDSNGSIYIKGGIIVSANQHKPNESLDSEGCQLYISDGMIFGIGAAPAKIGKCLCPYYNTAYNTDPNLPPERGLRLTPGRYTHIIDIQGNIIMSFLNPIGETRSFLTIVHPQLQENEVLEIGESEKLPIATSKQLFGGKLSIGGNLGNYTPVSIVSTIIDNEQ